MLYTTMPMEAIFPAEMESGATLAVNYLGRICLVRCHEDGIPRVERLLSTDPQDYLVPDFFPNSLVHMGL